MEFVSNSSSLSEYVLKIVYAYYIEGILTWRVQKTRVCDIVVMHALQSIIFFGVSLFSLISRAKRKHFRIKRRRKKAEKPKIVRIIKQARVAEDSKEEEGRGNMYIRERFEKIFLIVVLGLLSGIDICNKLILYSVLEYTTYPIIGIARSFRLFPTPFGILGQGIPLQSTFSIATTTMGIFTYIFSCEERVEDVEFLKKVSDLHDLGMLNADDRIKVIKLGLRFLCSCYSSESLEALCTSDKEPIFMKTILAHKLPEQEYALPIKDQVAIYYKNLLLLHKNKEISQDHPEVTKVFERILVDRNTTTPEIEKLALSFIKMITAGNNTRSFQAFLEKRKINAGIFLTLHSCIEVVLETGQIFLCNKFRIQPEFAITAMNLLSATSILGVIIYYPQAIIDVLKIYKKNLLISTLTLSYIKLFARKSGIVPLLNSRIGMQIGMKFFSLFLSIIFYGHEFSARHAIGIIIMIPGCLINLKNHNTLLSRWTLSGHLQRKYM